MVTRVELLRLLTRYIRSRPVGSFFINGAPGSGKSYELIGLAQHLPDEAGGRLVVLGPYAPTTVAQLTTSIKLELEAASYLSEPFPSEVGTDLFELWRWFAAQAHFPREQTFVVLVDLPERLTDLAALGDLFSSVRYLEGAWEHRLRVHHVFAGYWNQADLTRHYTRIRASFPYTRGHNYLLWAGLSVDEMTVLVMKARPVEAQPIHGPLLFELCGGHPAAALEIISAIAPGQLNYLNLLATTRELAQQGDAAQRLMKVWAQLSPDTLALVKKLITCRYVQVNFAPDGIEDLRACGLARTSRLGQTEYLTFRSWYVELIVRTQTATLGISDPARPRLNPEELMPEVLALNLEAYRLIHHIENTVRNFVVLYLRSQRPDDEFLLINRGLKQNLMTTELEDAHTRAMDWRNRRACNGVPVEANPLIAFLGTRDLAQLVAEISAEAHLPGWAFVAQALLDLANVRDAVMHQQLIDDEALTHLVDLQTLIYHALNEAQG